MSKRNLPKARCVASFTHIIPASVLEIRTLSGSYYPDARIETPERHITYSEGQLVTLSSKPALKAFLRAWPGAFEAVS